MGARKGARPTDATTTEPPILTIAAIALLATIVVAGCGRAPQADSGAAPSPMATTQVIVAPSARIPSATPAIPATPASPVASSATSTPVPTPDLTSIEALLSGIDNDLGNDATADTDEGSPQ